MANPFTSAAREYFGGKAPWESEEDVQKDYAERDAQQYKEMGFTGPHGTAPTTPPPPRPVATTPPPSKDAGSNWKLYLGIAAVAGVAILFLRRRR